MGAGWKWKWLEMACSKLRNDKWSWRATGIKIELSDATCRRKDGYATTTWCNKNYNVCKIWNTLMWFMVSHFIFEVFTFSCVLNTSRFPFIRLLCPPALSSEVSQTSKSGYFCAKLTGFQQWGHQKHTTINSKTHWKFTPNAPSSHSSSLSTREGNNQNKTRVKAQNAPFWINNCRNAPFQKLIAEMPTPDSLLQKCPRFSK